MQTRSVVIGGVIIALIVVGAVAYSDYASSRGTGTIELHHVPQGAVIFLDNERAGFGDGETETLERVAPGTHTVIVARDGHWPWSKKFSIRGEETLSAGVFLIAQQFSAPRVEEEDPRREALEEAFESAQLPTINEPLVHNDGTRLWLDGAEIVIQRPGEDPSFVLPSADPVLDIMFYPNRSDVIIFGTAEGIFVIEADRENTQNFQPILVDVDLRFVPFENGLAVRSGEHIALFGLK